MRRYVWWGAVSLVVVASAVGVLGWQFDWHWGDVPTWIAAVSTTAAFLVAGAAAVAVYRQLQDAARREVRDLDIRASEARKQAELINVFWGTGASKLLGPDSQVLVFYVENKSPRPIRDVHCRASVRDEPPISAAHATVATVKAGQALRGVAPQTYREDAPVRFVRRDTEVTFFFAIDAKEKRDAAYVVRFTDDADNHWQLTGEMRLTRIPDRSDW